jgi:acetolactate synthase-1/3 small subunit
MEKKQYTITAFTENHIGLLNKITIVFTRRKINIESLTVSESQIKGIHSFTIVVNSTKETVEKVVKQIDKRVDIIKSFYNTDEELVYQEIALYKVATDQFLALGSIEELIRKYNIRILEMTTNCVVLEKTGHYDETQGLFEELSEKLTILQFIRSGRIAINKSKIERLSDMLAKLNKEHQQ